MNKTLSVQPLVIINSYLRACTADLANVTVMELRLFGRPFGLLQLVLVKCGLFVGVYSRSRHHVAARVAPGRACELLGWWLDGRLGLLRLLRWGLRLGESLLGRLVIGGGRCGGVASWIITRVAYAWGWESRRESEDSELLKRREAHKMWVKHEQPAVVQAVSCILRPRRTSTIPKWSLRRLKDVTRDSSFSFKLARYQCLYTSASHHMLPGHHKTHSLHHSFAHHEKSKFHSSFELNWHNPVDLLARTNIFHQVQLWQQICAKYKLLPKRKMVWHALDK